MFHIILKGMYSHFPNFKLLAVRMPKVHVFRQLAEDGSRLLTALFPFQHPLHFFPSNVCLFGFITIEPNKNKKVNLFLMEKKNPNLNPMF